MIFSTLEMTLHTYQKKKEEEKNLKQYDIFEVPYLLDFLDLSCKKNLWTYNQY